MEKKRSCLYCGAELLKLPQGYRRKYCSKSCRNKYKLRLKKPEVQAKLWQHEQAVYESAMELHWNGAESASIARQFEIPVGTVYSWVHDFGKQKQRVEPLKNQLCLAESADEWLAALRESTLRDADFLEEPTVCLVCGHLRGQSVDRLATVIFEKLKYNPTNGKSYNPPPKTGLSTAVVYARNQREYLERYLEDGRLEISNNRAERSIKPFVIGRKNWLFANTPRGTKASAILYSIIETAKENRVNPYEYLTYVFKNAPNWNIRSNFDYLDLLMPWNAPGHTKMRKGI